MSYFNCKDRRKSLCVAISMFVALFCALLFSNSGVKATDIGDIGTDENYYVYVPKNSTTVVTDYGSATCATDYWDSTCNSRYAVKDKAFTMHVMLPYTIATGDATQQWSKDMTKFQWMITDKDTNPFLVNDTHLDSGIYSFSGGDAIWYDMSTIDSAASGMSVTHDASKFGDLVDGVNYIWVRYQLVSTDIVAFAYGTIIYEPTSSLTSANVKITRGVAATTATDSAYELSADVTAIENATGSPLIERVCWTVGTEKKKTGDFTSCSTYTNGTWGTIWATEKYDASDLKITADSNLVYTFYIQDRAGHAEVFEVDVKNIFGVATFVASGNLNQNVTDSDVCVKDNVVVTCEGNAVTYYKVGNVTFTATVLDKEGGNPADANLITWTITPSAKGSTGTVINTTGISYIWEKADYVNVYGTFVVSAKAGSINLTADGKTSLSLVVKPILNVNVTVTDEVTYGTEPTVSTSYGDFYYPVTNPTVKDTVSLVKNTTTDYDWASMKNVGTYTVSAEKSSTDYNEYAFVFGSDNFKINPKALTITYNGESKTYDGEEYNPSVISYFTLSGQVYGETLASIGDDVATAIINQGSYTIKGTGAVLNTTSTNGSLTANNASINNYTVTYASGTYTIYKVVVVPTFRYQDKEYKAAVFGAEFFEDASKWNISYYNNDGSNKATGNAISIPEGEEIAKFGYTTNPASPMTVGKYTVKADSITMVDRKGSDDNYVIANPTELGIFEITKKKLVITYLGDTITYDGQEHNDDVATITVGDVDKYTFNLTEDELENLKKVEGVKVTYSISFECLEGASSNYCTSATGASVIKAAGVYTITPTGLNKTTDVIEANYEIDSITSGSAKYTINRAPLTIKYTGASNVVSKVYDATPESFGSYSLYTFTDLFEDDSTVTSVSYTINGSSEVQSVTNVGTYSISPTNATFPTRDCYVLSITPVSGNYSITARPVIITFDANQLNIYDNAPRTFGDVSKYTLSSGIDEGFVSTHAPTSIGYDVTYPNGVDTTKVIDAGVYKITPKSEGTVWGTGYDANNYSITWVGNNYTIEQKAISLSLKTTSLAYIAESYEFTSGSLYNAQTLADGESLDKVVYTVKDTSDVVVDNDKVVSVGTYKVTPSSFTITGGKGVAGFNNYNLTGATSNINITRVKVDITGCSAEGTTKIYDGTDVAPNNFGISCIVAVNDGKNSITISVTQTSAKYDSVHASLNTTKGGATKITITGAVLGDTNFEWKDDVNTHYWAATITQKEVSLSSMKVEGSKTKAYDGTTDIKSDDIYKLVYVGEGLNLVVCDDDRNCDDLGLKYDKAFENSNVYTDESATIKTSRIKVTNATISNLDYNLVGTDRVDDGATITPLKATVKVNDITSSVYGTVEEMTYTFTGFLNNNVDVAKDYFVGLTTNYVNSKSTSYSDHRSVGTYSISPSATYVKYGNYDVTYAPGNLTVVKKDIVIKYTQSKTDYVNDTYDGIVRPTSLLTTASHYTIEGLVSDYGETVSSITSYSVKYKNFDEGSTYTELTSKELKEAGYYRITVLDFGVTGGNASSVNYNIKVEEANLGVHTINKYTLTVKFIDKAVDYKDDVYDVSDKSYYEFNIKDSDAEAWEALNVSFNYTVSGSSTTLREAGTYTVTPTEIESHNIPDTMYKNYNMDEIVWANGSGTLTIKVINATLVFESGQSSTYDGQPRDFSDYSKSSELWVVQYKLSEGEYQTGLVGDDLSSLSTITYTPTEIKNAGDYDILASGVTFKSDADSTNINANYNFTYGETGVGYTIKPIALVLGCGNGQFTCSGDTTKVYDGTTSTTYVMTYNQVVSGETAQNIGLTLSAAYNNANVNDSGSKKVTITATGPTSSNYTLAVKTLELDGFSITARTDAKIIVLLDGKQTTNTYTYGDVVNVTFLYTNFYSNGTVLTESAADQDLAKNQLTGLDHNYKPSFEGEDSWYDVTTGKTVIGSGATALNGNYDLTNAYVGASLVINQKELTVTYVGGTKVYDGNDVNLEAIFKPVANYEVSATAYEVEKVASISEYEIWLGSEKVEEINGYGEYVIKATDVVIEGGRAKSSNYKIINTVVDGNKNKYLVTKQTITFKFDTSTGKYKASAYDLSDIELYTLTDMSKIAEADKSAIWNSTLGDGVSVSYTVVRKVGEITKTDAVVANYGVYIISINKESLATALGTEITNNYDIEVDNTGTFTVEQLTLKVTFANTNNSKTYDGNEVVLTKASLYNVTIDGSDATADGDNVKLIGEDKLTAVSYNDNANTAYINKGEYTIKASDFTISSTYEKENYVLNNTDTGKYTINAKELILADFTIGGDKNKVYDGTTEVKDGDLTLTVVGLIGEDLVTFNYSVAYDNKNVDSVNNFNVTNASITGNENYYMDSDKNSRTISGAKINPAEIVLTNLTIYSKTFDNNATMFKGEYTYTTGIGNETLNLSWDDIENAFGTEYTVGLQTVTIAKTELTITDNLGFASNYVFNGGTAKAEIKGFTYNLSNCSISINYKTYDGTTAVPSEFKVTCNIGVTGIDDMELNYETATFNTANAKDHVQKAEKIVVTNMSIKDNKYSSSYGVILDTNEALSKEFAAHINPKKLDISSDAEFSYSEENLTKSYNGNADANVKLTYKDGNESIGYSDEAKYADANVGNNKQITLTGNLTNYNYCFSNDGEGETPNYTATRLFVGKITAPTVTITVLLNGFNDLKVEYGEVVVDSFSYSGFVDGENEDVLTSKPTTNLESISKNVRDEAYEVIGSGAIATNYEFAYKQATLKITPFEVKLIPISRKFEYTYSDEIDMSTIGTAYTLTRELPNNEKLKGSLTTTDNEKLKYDSTKFRYVGTYKILQGDITDEKNPNYSITYGEENGDYTIEIEDKIAPTVSGVEAVDYTPGDTATSNITFKVKANDEAWRLNDYNLKVKLIICAGDLTKGSEVSVCETPHKIIEEFKDSEGKLLNIATTKTGDETEFSLVPSKENGTFTYFFVAVDGSGNETLVADAKYILVSYLTPNFTYPNDEMKFKQGFIYFELPGYIQFLAGREGTWKYFFSKKNYNENEITTAFNNHGVLLNENSSSTYTKYSIETENGTLSGGAMNPLGLNGAGYRLLLQLTLSDGKKIVYESDEFEIYIDTTSAASMALDTNYSIDDGNMYDGTLTTLGNSIIVSSDEESTSLMSSNSKINGQVVYKLDKYGNSLWSIDFSEFGLTVGKVEDIDEETIVVTYGKSMKIAQLSLNQRFDDVDVVILKISQEGEIINVNRLESLGDDVVSAISVFGNEYIVVTSSTLGSKVYRVSSENNVVWTSVLEGKFDIRDVAFDNDIVALVGVAYDSEYVINSVPQSVRYRGEIDGLLITFTSEGELEFVRTLGSSKVDEFNKVELYDNLIYVLGNTEATMLYTSYSTPVLGLGKGGQDAFVAVYRKYDSKIEKITFVGGVGRETFDSILVDENGFVVVGTTTSTKTLELSAISGTQINLPEYNDTLTLVYEYDHDYKLNKVSHFSANSGSVVTDLVYDLDTDKLMMMSTGSSLVLRVERNFNEKDVNVSYYKKNGYVSVATDYSEIVITKDGIVVGNSTQFEIDSNGEYVVSVTDNTGRTVTKVLKVTSFIDADAVIDKNDTSSMIIVFSITYIILIAYLSIIFKSHKKRMKEAE